MNRFSLFLILSLAACASGPVPLPSADANPVITGVRPVVANDSLRGRWSITAVNGKKTISPWIELGGEGLGTVTRTANGILVGSPQPRTQAYLGCNHWYPNGWARNGDKLSLGTEMSVRTERGCDPDSMALDDQAYAILSKSMTMEFTPPSQLRLVNENGTLDLYRNRPEGA